MHIGVVTLFPQMIDDALGYGVIGRAKQSGQLKLHLENPRDWTSDRHRTVDDRPFGGGPGMVMKPAPLTKAIGAAKSAVGQDSQVVYLSPQGRVFDQALARTWQQRGSLVLVSGRYEGVDERVIRSVVDVEVSLGNFVLSGGEFAALAVIDAITRLVPDVLGDPLSAEEDSFGNSGLLDCPHYTRPEDHEGLKVPQVLLSGDHKAIARWRRHQALAKTWKCRPELLEKAVLTEEDTIFLTSLKSGNTLKGV
ncbi:MAG: tRNA (guanosine(37)-N1)-methyltransferase TrmD [Granulosicoccus sp.]